MAAANIWLEREWGGGVKDSALHHTNHLPENGLFCSKILRVEELDYFFPL